MQRTLNEQTSQPYTPLQGGPPDIPGPTFGALLGPAFGQIWEGIRIEIQNQLREQKGQYEQLLATEKALGEQRLQQAVAALRMQYEKVDQEMQRVTSLYQRALSENHTLREDAEKYKVEIRGFIAERKKIEKKSHLLAQENTKLLEKLEKKDGQIVWLSQEWSTARALRLKLHGENGQLLQELKDVSIYLKYVFTLDLLMILPISQ